MIVQTTSIHIMPVDDLVQHEPVDDCVCGPSIELLETGEWLIIHESLDRREDE